MSEFAREANDDEVVEPRAPFEAPDDDGWGSDFHQESSGIKDTPGGTVAELNRSDDPSAELSGLDLAELPDTPPPQDGANADATPPGAALGGEVLATKESERGPRDHDVDGKTDVRGNESIESELPPNSKAAQVDQALTLPDDSLEPHSHKGESAEDQDTAYLQHDIREGALAGYELDPISERQAIKAGQDVSLLVDPEAWRSGDFESRLQQVRDVEVAICAGLGVQIAPATIDVGLEPGVQYGWSDDECVGVGAWLVEVEDPKDVIETMAHEYRHRWQLEVISGKVEHPAGDGARLGLQSGQESYVNDLADFSGMQYVNNPLELDAEAFALSLYKSFSSSRKR